jgi:hypothetical protein
MPAVTASRRRLLIALLLPVLALRVLLPAGFMPVADAGELRIVMCSDGMQLPGTGPGDSGGHPPHEMGKCPFASAGFHAPPTQFVATAGMPVLSVQFHSFPAADLPPTTGPPRTSAARAPPHIS